MEGYFEAKARLFTEYEPGVCVVCTDAQPGKKLAMLCQQAGRKLIRVGSDASSEVRLVQADYAPHSTLVSLDVSGKALRFTLPLVGRFNVENALVAFGIGMALGFEIATIVHALESAQQVPGRLERVVGSDGSFLPFGILVDYAHTPDSVAKAISAVRAVTKGRVICVFGCGGDRDNSKRPKMGAASLAADLSIVTSDNPRTEDPQDIIDQIVPGMAGHEDDYRVIPDRATAIRYAIGQAEPGDVVLLAGKGHEDYQIIGTVKHHFDDREVAAAAIKEMGF
jgi:UDP-N-acetylmuramoyl-L-alanyl-D-glutamate--2,6-diaminopimelate ligase